MGTLAWGETAREEGREGRREKGKGLWECCGKAWGLLNKSHPQHLALGLHKE